MISPDPTPIPAEALESPPVPAPILDLILWAESEEALPVLLEIARTYLEPIVLPHLDRTKEQ